MVNIKFDERVVRKKANLFKGIRCRGESSETTKNETIFEFNYFSIFDFSLVRSLCVRSTCSSYNLMFMMI